MHNINKFIKTIEKGLYVEAHELLEDDWKFYRKRGEKVEEKAIQGLINGATALALYFIKKRPKSYEKVWKVFEKYKHFIDEAKLENIDRFKKARKLLIDINEKIEKTKAEF
jgi:uncharacterized protein YutE (UPF0331/DUF86 family)